MNHFINIYANYPLGSFTYRTLQCYYFNLLFAVGFW